MRHYTRSDYLASNILVLLAAILVIPAKPALAQAPAQSESQIAVSARQFMSLLDELDLIGFQKFQIEQLRENFDAQVLQILTPEQTLTWEAARQADQPRRQALQAIELQPQQQQQIQAIRQEARAVFRDIFTDQQWQELEMLRSLLPTPTVEANIQPQSLSPERGLNGKTDLESAGYGS